jgi:hypothetical protein
VLGRARHPQDGRPWRRHPRGFTRGLPRGAQRRIRESGSARAPSNSPRRSTCTTTRREHTNGMHARSRSSASRTRRARQPRLHSRSTRRKATSRRVPGRVNWSTRSLGSLERMERPGLEPATALCGRSRGVCASMDDETPSSQVSGQQDPCGGAPIALVAPARRITGQRFRRRRFRRYRRRRSGRASDRQRRRILISLVRIDPAVRHA